jgi:hypothetical protein
VSRKFLSTSVQDARTGTVSQKAVAFFVTASAEEAERTFQE